MTNLSFGNLTKSKNEFILINLIFQFYLFRTSVPIFKYPFLILFIVLFIYLIVLHGKKVVKSIKKFVSSYFLILGLFIILLIAFIFSSKIYLSVFKNIINVAILLSIFFSLLILIKNRKDLNIFIATFIEIVILFAVLISVIRLLDLLVIYQISLDDSLKVDKNFALLPAFYGIISILYLFNEKISKTKIIYYTILISIFSLNIILSGSRRGIFAYGIIIIILLLFHLIQHFLKFDFLRKLFINSKVFIISLIIIIIGGNILLFHTGCRYKNDMLETIGSKDIRLAKKNISVAVYNCISVINKGIDFIDFHKSIWFPNLDSSDPDCGWGFSDCKKVFPLVGENVEIVPTNAIGCLIDLNLYDSLDLSSKSFFIDKLNVKESEKYKAVLYCYVSKDFTQNRLRLKVPWNSSITKESRYTSVVNYDLKRKGIWQKLEIEFECLNGDVSMILIIDNKKNKNAIPLKGSIIIAYPQYNKIESSDSILSLEDNDTVNNINLIHRYRYVSEKLINLFKGKKSSLFSESDYDLYLSHSERDMLSYNIQNKYMQAGILNIPFSYLANVTLMINDNDLIRNWAAKFISEDTTYYGYKSDLFVDTISSKFTGPRIMRWQFAWQIFTKEYNWKQKIFGGGFDFLNWYGYYFLHDKTKSDYPHNPFLHILLYSGILGLMLYVFFMYKVFYYYIKYLKEYYILFIFFLITFFFTFFSGGNPFDPSIMGFFVILPFFIHSVHKNSMSE